MKRLVTRYKCRECNRVVHLRQPEQPGTKFSRCHRRMDGRACPGQFEENGWVDIDERRPAVRL